MTTGRSEGSPRDEAGSMRLQRFLARAGIASRRKAEEYIVAGRVAVNGDVTSELGTTVDPRSDVVTFDGEPVCLPVEQHYYLLHKPAGYVTTMSDPQGRHTIAELVPDDPGLFPVGRLDQNTTGALLITDDGRLAHRLMHPSFHAPKVYRAIVRGEVTAKGVELLSGGLTLDDGPTRPADVEVLDTEPGSSEVRITLREGRKRQVRRMFERIGHPVEYLHRESFGPVVLGELPEGEVRELSADETAALKQAARMEP
jgi:23S rRNA pseudouridine2605 synthase